MDIPQRASSYSRSWWVLAASSLYLGAKTEPRPSPSPPPLRGAAPCVATPQDFCIFAAEAFPQAKHSCQINISSRLVSIAPIASTVSWGRGLWPRHCVRRCWSASSHTPISSVARVGSGRRQPHACSPRRSTVPTCSPTARPATRVRAAAPSTSSAPSISSSSTPRPIIRSTTSVP